MSRKFSSGFLLPKKVVKFIYIFEILIFSTSRLYYLKACLSALDFSLYYARFLLSDVEPCRAGSVQALCTFDSTFSQDQISIAET